MSATCVCTRATLLLKSKTPRMPTTRRAVTASVTSASTRVKPAAREILAGLSAWLFACGDMSRNSSSERPQQAQGHLLAAAERSAAARALDRHADLLEMDEGRIGAAGQRLRGLEVAVGQGAQPVLAHRPGARPEGCLPAGDDGHPLLVAGLRRVAGHPVVLELLR